MKGRVAAKRQKRTFQSTNTKTYRVGGEMKTIVAREKLRKSAIPFRNESGPAAALSHAHISVSSQDLGWKGVSVEVGRNEGWSVDDLVIAGHYAAVNLKPDPLYIQRRQGRRWEHEIIPPQCLWIQPAGVPFSFRVNQVSDYAGVVLETDRVRAIAGRDVVFPPAFGSGDEVTVHLIHALVGVARQRQAGSLALVDALAAALTHRLISTANDEEFQRTKGGIPRHRIRLIEAFVESNIAKEFAVDDLARLAGLSSFHFAREFKRSMGFSPHQYVIKQRVEHAKQLLMDARLSIADVAADCGFSDQAHLSRTFKQLVGFTPGQWQKNAR
jgi:AraC family transcriptional regulator